MKSAKTVAQSVEQTVAELESPKGKLLSKEAKATKVTAAIKMLQGLEGDFQKMATQSVSQRKADLMKQLHDKEAMLAKEQKELKVIKLEEKLAEKKLALKKAAERQEMVANVLNMAKSLQAAQGKGSSMTHAAAKVTDGKAEMLKTVLAHLEGRMHNVSASIDKIN